MNLVGKRSEPFVLEYTEKDVILYALSVGAQADELHFVYENAKGGLKVLPGFAALAQNPGLNMLGDDIDNSRLFHGEQCISLHNTIPPKGKITTVAQITDIFDKGKAAVIHVRGESTSEDGELLFVNTAALFYLGAGNFGGPRGPKTDIVTPPEGQDPDFSVTYAIPESQAALYRLNGDLNPLHIDPEIAKKGDLEKPILHGLCTYGYSIRAIVNSVCGGDTKRFVSFTARFGNVVYPGDTLITEGWKGEENSYIVQARTERHVVIKNAHVKIK